MAISPPRTAPLHTPDSGHRYDSLPMHSDDPPSGIGLKAPPFREPATAREAAPRRSFGQRLMGMFGFGKAADTLQMSVFGPTTVVPGETIKVTINVHRPSDAAGVKTLARAFQQDAELLGTGEVGGETVRDTQMALHLSLANAGVGKALQTFMWRGQPRRVVFEVFVPWEAPTGWASGIVSIAFNNVLIGQTEVTLHVLPRKG